ncbi:MAG: hypothetical protein WCP85_22670 [Mariniphaga sp.]
MKTFILCILTVFIVSPLAKCGNPEKLLGITFDYEKGEVTLVVVSSGCTQKSDFKFEIKGENLTIIRIRPDNCKMMESKEQFTFTLKEAKIDPNKPYVILNKFIANHNIAKIQ